MSLPEDGFPPGWREQQAEDENAELRQRLETAEAQRDRFDSVLQGVQDERDELRAALMELREAATEWHRRSCDGCGGTDSVSVSHARFVDALNCNTVAPDSRDGIRTPEGPTACPRCREGCMHPTRCDCQCHQETRA